jgi:hypothetical protein
MALMAYKGNPEEQANQGSIILQSGAHTHAGALSQGGLSTSHGDNALPAFGLPDPGTHMTGLSSTVDPKASATPFMGLY